MKRKKKEGDDTKDQKPKKYKRKIENPEKQKARYVYDNKGESGKLWEKNRRDRLNKTFDELSLLLPPKEPPGKMSKVEILAASIKYFEIMSEKLIKVERELNALKDKNKNVTNIVKETKDSWCNTDIFEHDKENFYAKIDKNTQVNFIKKSKKSLKSKVKYEKCIEKTSSSSQTDVSSLNLAGVATINLKQLNESSLNQTTVVARSEASTPLELPLIPTCTTVVSSTANIFSTISSNVPYLSSSVRVTPALISTPIMTPSLFISNYPFVVSQIPQSVYIVNNKTEVTTTVNKACTVKSKTIAGRVPLPPLKKTVAIKKLPRKKRVLKKKRKNSETKTKETDENIINAKNKDESTNINMCSEQSNSDINNSVSITEETTITDNNIRLFKETEVMETNGSYSEVICSNKNIIRSINEKSPKISHNLNNNTFTATTSSESMQLEKSPVTSNLLNLNSSQRNTQIQEAASVNDTTAINNVDLENFSLFTDNILSSIENNETNECTTPHQLSRSIEKEKPQELSVVKLLTESKNYESPKLKGSGKSIEVLEKMEKEKSMTKALVPSIQVRKGLHNDANNSSNLLHVNQIDTVMTTSASYIQNYSTCNASNSFTFSLSNTTATNPQDKLAYQTKNMSHVSSRFDTIGNYTSTYTTTGSCYANSFNYSAYYNSTRSSTSDARAHSNFQPTYTSYAGNISGSNSQTSNISQQYTAKAYDSQRPFYVEQPSTNFTFSLTSVSKAQSKYTSSSGNKSQPQTYIQPSDTCKKSNTKSCNYNYNLENTTPRTLSSHSIARLNSKYENHKENDVPFYLNQDISYSKLSKSNVNQSLLPNNLPCAKYSTVQSSQTKQQPLNNKLTKTSSSNSHHSQFTSKYDVDWMSSSEIKPSNTDFQLFPPMEFSQTNAINQNSYYSPVTNFDINRKTSDLYFAHPPGEENLPWSPNRMSNIETPHISANHCFPTTLPNLHGDLALNTMPSNSSRSINSNVLDTPPKPVTGNYNSTFNSKEIKRSNTTSDSQTSSFSVRQLVDNNTGNKNVSGDKTSTIRRKTLRKDGEVETYSNEIIPYDNHKSNIYSAESLINSRSSKTKSNWHSEPHTMPQDLNLSSTMFPSVDTLNDQYNYTSTRYDPKLFNQNYVGTFVDNSLSNSTQNFHNFTKSQPFTFGDQLNSTMDFLQSGIGGTVNSFLTHPETNAEKSVQNLYGDLSKSSHSTNVHMHSSRTNPTIGTSTTHATKKSKPSHQPTPSHHSLLMNYDFPVPPVTPSLTYFPAHDWKSTATETYPSCSNSYVNNINLYSQNITQNSQPQNNSIVPLPGNAVHNSNSLTNFNLSSICPEINDKVRQQNW